MRKSVIEKARSYGLPVSVERHVELADGFSRAVVYIPDIRSWTIGEVASAFANKGLQLCEMFKTERKNVFQAFFSATKKVVPAEEASAKGFNEIEKNIFADSDDNIWDTVDTASGKFLVKRTDVSAKELLEALRARGEVASIHTDIAIEEASALGDVVLAFDKGITRTGIVTAENRIFDIKTNEFASIEPNQVVCVVSNAYSLENGEIASVEAGKKLVSYNKSLFDEIQDTINSATKVA